MEADVNYALCKSREDSVTIHLLRTFSQITIMWIYSYNYMYTWYWYIWKVILYSCDPEQHYSSMHYCNIISLPFFQSDVYICMELMTTCLDKLMKKLQGPIPEDVLGKISLSVSTPCLFSSSLRSSLFRFLSGMRKSREGSGTEVTKH